MNELAKLYDVFQEFYTKAKIKKLLKEMEYLAFNSENTNIKFKATEFLLSNALRLAEKYISVGQEDKPLLPNIVINLPDNIRFNSSNSKDED